MKRVTKAVRVARAQKELRSALLDEQQDLSDIVRRQRATIQRLKADLSDARAELRELAEIIIATEKNGGTLFVARGRVGAGLVAYLKKK